MINFRRSVSMMGVAAMVMLVSCDKDDEGSGTVDDKVAVEQNEQEERQTPIAEIEEGVSIEGANKIAGAPPEPNSDLDFQMDASAPQAYQEAGFTIEFSSSAEIVGAYLVFSDVSGTKSGSYYDIPVSVFKSATLEKSTNLTERKRGQNLIKSSHIESEYAIDVDFAEIIKPGQFCYGICVYDSENNVSQAIKVCVEVEAWGGNSALVGEWELYDSDEWDDSSYYEDDLATIYCESGSTFEAAYYMDDEGALTIKFMEDGTFEMADSYSDQYLDYEESYMQCSAIYASYSSSSTAAGNWAYNETNSFLGLVYSSLVEIETEYGETETYTYDDDELDDSQVGVYVEFEGDVLILSEDYTDEDGYEYSDKYYFRRK